MKILITGGAGFIGTNSALFFKEKGYNEIHIFDNLSKKGSEKNLKMLNFVKFHNGDLSKLQDIDKCLKERDKIYLEIKNLFDKNVTIDNVGEEKHPADESGESLVYSINFDFTSNRS